MDPHGAVAYLALNAYQKEHPNTTGIFLETAHPSKFKEDMERIVGHSIDVPSRLACIQDQKKEAFSMPTEYKTFKNWLINAHS